MFFATDWIIIQNNCVSGSTDWFLNSKAVLLEQNKISLLAGANKLLVVLLIVKICSF